MAEKIFRGDIMAENAKKINVKKRIIIWVIIILVIAAGVYARAEYKRTQLGRVSRPLWTSSFQGNMS